jgi:hypothetical protein
MSSAVDLTASQREAAEKCGASFWNTYEAMQRMGGMTRFVENGWAGKDYTHINYGGGRQIAGALFRALYADLYAYWQRETEHRIQRAEEQPLLNSELVDVQLFNPSFELNP